MQKTLWSARQDIRYLRIRADWVRFKERIAPYTLRIAAVLNLGVFSGGVFRGAVRAPAL